MDIGHLIIFFAIPLACWMAFVLLMPDVWLKEYDSRNKFLTIEEVVEELRYPPLLTFWMAIELERLALLGKCEVLDYPDQPRRYGGWRYHPSP